jgi:hypothetical protein
MSRKSTFMYATLTAYTLSTLLSSTASAAHFGGGSGFRPSAASFHRSVASVQRPAATFRRPIATFRQPIGGLKKAGPIAGMKKMEYRGDLPKQPPNAGSVVVRNWPGPKNPPWGPGCEACPPGRPNWHNPVTSPNSPGINSPGSTGVAGNAGPISRARGGNGPPWPVRTSTNSQTPLSPACDVCDPDGRKIWEAGVGLGAALAGGVALVAGLVASAAPATSSAPVVAAVAGGAAAGLSIALGLEQVATSLTDASQTQTNGANDTGGTLPDGGGGGGGGSGTNTAPPQAQEANTIEIDVDNNWVEKDKDGNVVASGGPTSRGGGGGGGGSNLDGGTPIATEAAQQMSGAGNTDQPADAGAHTDSGETGTVDAAKVDGGE